MISSCLMVVILEMVMIIVILEMVIMFMLPTSKGHMINNWIQLK